MHWWQLPFSSPSKSQSAAADMLIAGAESEKTGVFSSRWSCGKVRQLTQNDADEWRSKSCSPHSRSRSSSASASAQPLPLPEFVCTPSHNVPLPSPAAGWSRRGGCGEERERLAAERRGLDQQLKRTSYISSSRRISFQIGLADFGGSFWFWILDLYEQFTIIICFSTDLGKFEAH